MNKNKESQKVVMFETLGYSLLPLALYYLMKNNRVIYLTINKRLAGFRLLRKFFANGQLMEVPDSVLDFKKSVLAYDLPLDDVEPVYNRYLENAWLIRLMKKLLKSHLIHTAYKIALAEKLFKFYRIQIFLNELAENYDRESKIYFFPEETIAMISFLKRNKRIPSFHKRIRIPSWAYLISLVIYFLKKLKFIFFMAVLPFWLFGKIKKIVLRKGSPRKYQAGIRIYNDDFGFRFKYRSSDFLLDGNNLNTSNVIFCVENRLSEDYMQKLKDKRYQFVEVLDVLKEVDWMFINRVFIRTFIPYWAGAIVFSFFAPQFAIRTTLSIMYKYLLWTRFLQVYEIKNYVVYNDYDAAHIVRNIIFLQKGIKTFYYAHSCHTLDLFTPPNCNDFRDIGCSFMFYDNFISWGEKMTRFRLLHPNFIGEYKNIGCLWSEHIRDVIKGNSLLKLKTSVTAQMKRSPDRIVSVFDTTFWGYGTLLDINDMEGFFRGILRLLDDYPNLGIILKRKWILDEMLSAIPYAASMYEQIEMHPQCYCVKVDQRDPAEIIAISDLVISACFTSTSVEALGARKKAIYFDATNKFKGVFYDKFPNLVAHGYSELNRIVRYWLYEAKAADFNNYVDTYVKGELDTYADGKAITRFRQLLCE